MSTKSRKNKKKLLVMPSLRELRLNKLIKYYDELISERFANSYIIAKSVKNKACSNIKKADELLTHKITKLENLINKYTNNN